MKLPFTWEELTPEDKAWLDHFPAGAIWDFIDTLPPDERAPFDADLYAPSGADFMREYGERLREYLANHPDGKEWAPWGGGEALQKTDPLVITEKRKAKEHATRSQGGTDRALTEAKRKIAELEARVAKITEERDAARREYLKLLDRQKKLGK